MTTEYEIAGSTRDELIFTKEQLIVDTPIVRHWASKKELPPTVNIDQAQGPGGYSRPQQATEKTSKPAGGKRAEPVASRAVRAEDDASEMVPPTASRRVEVDPPDDAGGDVA